MKPRILHLVTGLDRGGAESSLVKTIPPLEHSFENVVCFLRGTGPLSKELEEKGIRVVALSLSLRHPLRAVFRFRKLVREFCPHMLVTYLIHSDIFGRIFGRAFGIRKVLCSRRGFYRNWKSLGAIDRLTASLADGFLVQTQYAKATLAHSLNIPLHKIAVIPNAIDIERFSRSLSETENIRRSLSIPREAIVIICVATLKCGKGYPELLSAFEGVFAKRPDALLVIVGDGPEKSRYQEHIKNFRSRPAILFLGERTDVARILSVSDIFVLATHSEGMSNAILEAMASGLPVITTDIEVNREVVSDRVSGILVPQENPDTLREAILSLIEDTKSRHTLGQAAQAVVRKNFNVPHVADMMKRHYESILSI